MQPPIKYLPVNWVNGMKISQDHFRLQELGFYEQIRDQVCLNLNSYNYGLIDSGKDRPNPAIEIIHTPSTMTVQLTYCNAITSDGVRVTFEANELLMPLEVACEVPEKPALYHLILITNPYQRVPYGEPNPEESPLRFPHTISKYQLEVVPVQENTMKVKHPYSLIIGQVNLSKDSAEMIEDFVPPCQITQASPRLSEFLQYTLTSLQEIYQQTSATLSKLAEIAATEHQKYVMNRICYTINYFIADHFDEIHDKIPEQPPLDLILFYKKYARMLLLEIDATDDTTRLWLSELLKKTSDRWYEDLKEIIQLTYHHESIAQAIQKTRPLFNLLPTLLEQFAEMKSPIPEDPLPKPEIKAPPVKPRVQESLFIREEDAQKNQRKKGLWNFS